MTKKLSNKKGFTLAELLVVVAIIAVLVAVSIPIFSAQTKKANLATNQANARAAKAAAVSEVLGNGYDSTKTIYAYDITKGTGAFGSDNGKLTIATTSLDISAWAITTQLGSSADDNMGSTTYKKWYVTVDQTGAVTAYAADKQ